MINMYDNHTARETYVSHKRIVNLWKSYDKRTFWPTYDYHAVQCTVIMHGANVLLQYVCKSYDYHTVESMVAVRFHQRMVIMRCTFGHVVLVHMVHTVWLLLTTHDLHWFNSVTYKSRQSLLVISSRLGPLPSPKKYSIFILCENTWPPLSEFLLRKKKIYIYSNLTSMLYQSLCYIMSHLWRHLVFFKL